MRIKKYLVHSLPEAMEQIRSDLGQEAIILNTKKIKTKGFLGLFKKQQIEVIAALDPEKKEEKKAKEIFVPHNKASVSSTPKIGDEQQKDIHQEKVISEIKDIKNYLFQMLTEKDDKLSPPLKMATQCLQHHDLLQEVSSQIISNLILREEGSKLGEQEITSWLREEIIHFLNNNSASMRHSFAKVTCFIGPTGVGKTTTIAKLAARLMLKDRKKVGFITTDTYRIAAVEQLKTYAGILGIPTEVVYTPSDLEDALLRLESCDVILMDTAGRNYLEKEFVDELTQLLGSTKNVQTNLVISLTSKYTDVQNILTSFRELKIDSILFTKLDETRSYGHILNIVHEYGYSISYLTNGQDVPDDILLASPQLIADLIVGEVAHA